MAEMKNREITPIPGIEYSEIHIPDEKVVGTGTFTSVLEPKALTKINPIISSIQNDPIFLMIVSINIAISQVTAMIGKSHNTAPLDRKVFIIPDSIDDEKANDFTVKFNDWDIESIILNGDELTLAE